MEHRKTPSAASLGNALHWAWAIGAALGRSPPHIALAPWPASCNLNGASAVRISAQGSRTFYAE